MYLRKRDILEARLQQFKAENLEIKVFLHPKSDNSMEEHANGFLNFIGSFRELRGLDLSFNSHFVVSYDLMSSRQLCAPQFCHIYEFNLPGLERLRIRGLRSPHDQLLSLSVVTLKPSSGCLLWDARRVNVDPFVSYLVALRVVFP